MRDEFDNVSESTGPARHVAPRVEGHFNFTKNIREDGSEKAFLIVSPRAAEEMGSASDVNRVFQGSVDSPGVTILITEADFDYAVSGEFKQDGEREDQAQIRYMHETFGELMNSVTEQRYENLEPDQVALVWQSYTSEEDVFTNFNFSRKFDVHFNEGDIRIIKLNLEEWSANFSLEGSRQQQMDYLLGHELEHNDKSRMVTQPHGTGSELESDIAGILAATTGRSLWAKIFEKNYASQEEFTKSAIADRVGDELSRIIIKEFEEVSFDLQKMLRDSAVRFSHNTGFYIDPEEPAASVLPENAQGQLEGFEKLFEEYIDKGNVIKGIKARLDFPATPTDFLFSNDSIVHLFFDEYFEQILDELNLTDEEEQHFIDRQDEIYNQYRVIYMNAEGNTDEDSASRKALIEVSKELREAYPDFVDQQINQALWLPVFEDDLEDIIEELQKGGEIPEKQAEVYLEEIELINDNYYEDDSDDADQTYQAVVIEFMQRFSVEHPETLERTYGTNDQIVLSVALGINPRAIEEAGAEILRELYKNEDIQDAEIKRGVEIYLQERGLLQTDEIKPHTLQSPPI